jgi:hypothetical protein
MACRDGLRVKNAEPEINTILRTGSRRGWQDLLTIKSRVSEPVMFPVLRPLLCQTLTAALFGALLLVPVAAFVLSGDRADIPRSRLAPVDACGVASNGCAAASHWRETRFPGR